MKVPLKWLKDYVKITLPVTELAEGLTATGLEVGEIINTGGAWENVIIGEVTAINPHPNADRLKLATVNLGKEQETVVCGAPNLNKGDKIAFARVGARLINPETRKAEELKAAKIRGVESRGMICSERELGISDSHEGIMVLAGEAEVGTALADFMGDTVLDIDVTANRPDCLSVVGIAREAAAICGEKVNIPEIIYEEVGEPIEKQASVEIIDSELCPRYCASLITNVKIKESPAWLQERLIACGQRPISNIVDITNYIMLEYGQPLHSFDYEKLKGGKIVVQRAKDGEKFYTLDGEERKLTGDMLTIRDGERAVAIAGVMGGLNSDVTESTTSILLEAASFKATSLHHTSRYLGLTSEASMRFERDIGAGLTIPALKHATQLIAELGGGKVAKGIIDVYPGKKDPEPITITTEKTERLIGVAYNSEQIVKALTALGIECKAEGAKVRATAPYWRSDIKIEEDLIEEVARFYGYDKIPLTLLGQEIPRQDPSPEINLKKAITTSLAGMGFQEIMNYSLTSLDMINKVASDPDTVKPLRLTNPMTADQEYLRPSLRGNLLSTLAANRRHEEGGVALFEVGKVYIPRKNDLPDEPEMLCGVMNGDRAERSWLGSESACDFYDVKGVMEGLFRQLGIDISFENSQDEGLHPARQAAITATNNGRKVKLGVIGEVHPKTADAFEIEGTVCLFEISIGAMLPLASQVKMYKPVPRFPSTVRDMALVVDTSVTNQQILDIVKGFKLISEVELFDVYAGKQVAEGKKSLAYRLIYQAPDHTLTDEEVNKVQEQVTARLAKELGVTLRK
ncbi:MAG: phenylalanine--tRNA ligase subunit beta [Dehalococcoidales bacterium]|nr:phenylalanine--tRNA ligase subunit beta [Dehalococcoidales bacterium]